MTTQPTSRTRTEVPDVVAMVRGGLQNALRSMIVGDAPPVRDFSQPISGDLGLFGPESVTWRIHADASMLIGGVTALLLQMMHPLAMAGVADHSAYRTDPQGRLARTAQFVGATTYGTTEDAERAVAIVKRVHERVQGVAPDGRAYAANDPHLLAWVHHALVDSFLRSYRKYGQRPLSRADADRYVAEQVALAELIGATDPAPAASVAELRNWMSAIRPELAAGSQARNASRFLLFAPLPLVARGPYGLIAGAAVGLLPGWVRWQLRLPPLPVTERLAVRPAASVLTRVLGWAMDAPPSASSR